MSGAPGRLAACAAGVVLCLVMPGGEARRLAAAASDPVTTTYQIANSLDDVTQVNGTLDEFGATLWVGTGGSATASYTGLRFRLDIPRGSVIASARLEVNAAQTQWLAVAFETGIEAGPSATPFSGQALPSMRTLLPGRVPHATNVQWVQDTWYSLGEMGPMLQQVVDHAAWTPTSSAAFVVRGTSGTWGRKFVHALDGVPLRAPRLVVTYTPAALPPPPPPPPQATGFTNNKILVGFAAPTSITVVPDGRLLVTERAGRVRVVLPGRTNYEPVPFLQLTNIESLVGERALIDLALDPEFATNGRYYVFYTRRSPLLDTVSRFTAVGNTTDPATEVVIHQDDRPSSDIHHGGGLGFGPDGRLYISTGDGHDTQPGTAHAAQQLTTYRGKVLRLNRDGTIPADNPFHDGPGPNLDAIWALGFRNPFRLSVDAATGALHVYDVGGGAWEEVNVVTRGANYGWPLCEGACATPGTTNPLFAYPHPNRDSAIGGGVVYRGTAFPESHRGNLFYGDFAQAWIRRLTLAADGSVTGNLPFDPPDGASDGPTGLVVDLAVGLDGALYYVNIGGGSVHRISYYSGNRPPVITSATGTPTTGTTAPLPVQFAVQADDADGQPLTYRWEFGDGSTSVARDPLHLYGTTGAFTARVIVSDGAATAFSEPIEIRIGSPPIASITAPVDGATFHAADQIAFAGTADDDDEILTAAAFSWTVAFHHDGHIHPGFGPFAGITSGSFAVPTSGHDFSGNTFYELVLTVSDSQGLMSTVSHTLRPEKANLTLASDPPGLQLSLDTSIRPAPFVQDTLVGFTHRVTAPTPQQLGGVTYHFAGWSDGGALAHDITAPATATTLVATYRPQPALRVADVAVPEGNTGSTALTFTVTLSAASAQTVSVTATTGNATATAGPDYTAASSVLVFAPGVTVRPFVVSVVGDTLAEPDETLVVNLTAATNAAIADAQGVGTITNDDAPPAGPVTVTVPIVGTTDDVNEAGTDYQATGTTVWLGNGGTATTSYTGLRFAGVDVPRGAAIVSARLEVNAAQTQWIGLQYQIGIEDGGNSPSFSSAARPSARLLAPPRIAHASNVQWVTGSWYAVDGLGPLVQAVISRADWTRLNSLALVLRGTGPSWGRKFIRSRDAGAATAPRLIVVYNPPPP